MLELEDGRWLLGGEEGYIAISTNQGVDWRALPKLSSEEVVLHLMQRRDTRLMMVTDRDREIVVYESEDNPIAWKEVKRLPSEREQGLLTRDFTESAHLMPDFAASSHDRLVIYRHPVTLTSFDFKTGVWESHSTPRGFGGGIKVTADGHVVGVVIAQWVYASSDYGKTWNRLEGWLAMSEPFFQDRQRGVVIAKDYSFSADAPYKARTTTDGGKTWAPGNDAKGYDPGYLYLKDPFNRTLPGLWIDPAGRVWIGMDGAGYLKVSTDGGRTWKSL